MKSVQQIMEPDGSWTPVEKILFGENWQEKVSRHTETIESRSAKYDSQIANHLAMKSLKDEMDDDQWDYFANIRGVAPEFWNFAIFGLGQARIATMTKYGYLKVTDMNQFEKINRKGKIAMELRGDDEMLCSDLVRTTVVDYMPWYEYLHKIEQLVEHDIAPKDAIDFFWEGFNEVAHMIFIITQNGLAVKFPADDLRSKGRHSKGLYGVKLKGDDEVVRMAALNNSDEVVLITSKGIGKRVKVDEFRRMKRNAVGVKCLDVSEKTGKLVVALPIKKEDENLMLLCKSGQMIKIPSHQVPRYKRQAKGVIVIKMKEGDEVVSGATISA